MDLQLARRTRLIGGVAPIAFDPGMTAPLATLDNAANWRLRQAAE